MAKNEVLFSNTSRGLLACEHVKGPRKAIMIPTITHHAIHVAERELERKVAIDWFDKYLKLAGGAVHAGHAAEPPAATATGIRAPGGFRQTRGGKGSFAVAQIYSEPSITQPHDASRTWRLDTWPVACARRVRTH